MCTPTQMVESVPFFRWIAESVTLTNKRRKKKIEKKKIRNTFEGIVVIKRKKLKLEYICFCALFKNYDTISTIWNRNENSLLDIFGVMLKQGNQMENNTHGNSDAIESHHLLKYNRRLWYYVWVSPFFLILLKQHRHFSIENLSIQN